MKRRNDTNSTLKKKSRRARKFVFNDTSPSPFIPDAFCQCFKGYKGLDCSQEPPLRNNLSKVVAHKAGTTHRFSKRANPSSLVLDGDNANSNIQQQDGGWDEALKDDANNEAKKKRIQVVAPSKSSSSSEVKKVATPPATTVSSSTVASVKTVLGNGCPSHCSQHGICMQERCYCHTGYTGMSCSLKLKPGSNVGVNLKAAFIDSGMVKYASTLFGLGLLVPFIFNRLTKTFQDGNGKINRFFKSSKSKGANRKLINHW